MNHFLYGVERCVNVNTREYYIKGLTLYDDVEDTTVIDLLLSMPGVSEAVFTGPHSVAVTRKPRAAWRDVEPQILDLMRGIVACTDLAMAAIYKVQEEMAFAEAFREKLKVIRPSGERKVRRTVGD